jgi:hypothetical protein
MLLYAFAVFICLFVVSLTGLVFLHRHIESRIPQPVLENNARLKQENAESVAAQRRY